MPEDIQTHLAGNVPADLAKIGPVSLLTDPVLVESVAPTGEDPVLEPITAVQRRKLGHLPSVNFHKFTSILFKFILGQIS
jgi:hypothetical protein